MASQLRPERSLLVVPAHRSECRFGTGFYRLNLKGGGARYCETETQVRAAYSLLARDQVLSIDRDGYCLDGDRVGDANTPDVVDGEWWLGLDRASGMRELGLESEADYGRVYAQIEAAVYRRDNRASQSGVRASIVIKRAGAKVTDV